MIVKVNKKHSKETEKSEIVFISYDDIHRNKYISKKDIKEINKLVGINDFIYYPKKINSECGGGDPIETIVIPIAVAVFSSALFETLKFAVVELIKRIRKRTQKEKDIFYTIDFHISDEQSGFKLDLSSDVNADAKEIESLLDKAKEIVEVVKR